MTSTLESFYDFANRSHIFRRVVLYCGLGINFYAFHWAVNYANMTTGMPELATAAIIAAILTPATGLLAGMFKFYNEGRTKETSK
jgi:hypothetical protein